MCKFTAFTNKASPAEELEEVNLVQCDYILPFMTSRGLPQTLCNTYSQRTLHNTKHNICNIAKQIVYKI